jgi:lysophospholipase L1-like esterase
VCHADPDCVEQSHLAEKLGGDLDRIVGALHGAAPHAEIVLVATYNPFSRVVPQSDPLWQSDYGDVVAAAAARNGVLVADLFDTFHGPQLCQLTFFCATGDIHPTDAGYKRIADVIFGVAFS